MLEKRSVKRSNCFVAGAVYKYTVANVEFEYSVDELLKVAWFAFFFQLFGIIHRVNFVLRDVHPV